MSSKSNIAQKGSLVQDFPRLARWLMYSTFAIFIIVLFIDRKAFFTVYDHARLGKIYSGSQYVQGPKATTSIGDDGLFAVAGYYLFFQKGDPSQIHFESPPLGEYFIGLSIFLFRNERVINIIYGLLFLLGVQKLATSVSRNKLIGSLASFLIVLNPMFYDHMITSLLDLPQALFLTWALYFFFDSIQNGRKRFYLMGLFLGCAFSIKFLPGIVFFVVVLSLWCFFKRREYIISFLTSLVFVPIVYLLSYSMYFFNGHTFIDFIQFQKWVIVWRLGNPRVFGNIFTNLLFGQYRSWWEPVVWLHANEWTILSPIVFIGSLISPLVFWKRNSTLFYLYSLMFVYLVYIGFLTTGVSKYIFPIYALMTLFAGVTIAYFVQSLGKRLRLI